MGLSIRPPPATIPTMARLFDGITFLAPDGSFTRVFLLWNFNLIIPSRHP
ncbi:GSCOCG00004535001-RA-CDS [Cotesia congregata]|nr:GSCOCG00004535001-RA-CDS [Cotesia congregata]